MTNALAAAMAVLHADPTLSTAAEYRRLPAAWASVTVIEARSVDPFGGVIAGSISVRVPAASLPVSRPMRGDEMRIDGVVYAVEEPTRGTRGIVWRLTLSTRPTDALGAALPDARLGAIRYGAWYAPGPGDALTDAEAAALSPAAYHARAPFYAAVGSNVALAAGTQAIADAEISMAANAGLAFWAFLAWEPGNPNTAALDLYRASSVKAQIKYCLIEPMVNIYQSGAFTAAMMRTLDCMADAEYLTVSIAGVERPVLFLLAGSDADLVSHYGSVAATATVVQGIRDLAAEDALADPYIVVMSSWAAGAVALAAYGADAVGAYAAVGSIATETAYPDLAATADQWRLDALDAGAAAVVPPVMTGWDVRPRIATPSAYFGAEVDFDPAAFWQRPTATELARHVTDAVAWLRENGDAAPAQIATLYAWDEFTEGGWLCPTWVDGAPAGDTARLAVLAAALIASGAYVPVEVEATLYPTWDTFVIGTDTLI